MAIAIASGATPAQGLYTAIVGGFLVSLLGGSRFQVGGPAGAFIVLVASIVALHGMDGLILATFLSGLMLAIIGFLRLGTFIKFIPFPVTVGFTAGIAVIKRGHRVTEVGPWELGRVCAVQKRDGLFYAASTPRHMQGYAIAR
jgi:SulP family sulfate permease